MMKPSSSPRGLRLLQGRLSLAFAVAAGRVVARAVTVARRGGGTSLPGLVAGRIVPDIASLLAADLPHGSIVVAGTNGKTTTTALIAAALEAHGLTPVHNRAGANLLRGVISTLLAHAGANGHLRVDPNAIGLFESDEAALPEIVRAVQPRMIVVTNLFRDQLDRYGELDGIAARWHAAFAVLPPSILILNCDDPLVSSLGDGTAHQVVYYGFDLPAGRFERPPESADSISCRRCGSLLAYTHVYYGHLGLYSCPRCGWGRQRPDVSGRQIALRGLDGMTLDLVFGEENLQVLSRLPGLYNGYNVLAALCLSWVLGIDSAHAVAAVERVRGAFGRAERIQVDGRSVVLLLVKNPTGCDEVLRLLEDENGLDLLVALNDNPADGEDVSWIWDAEFEEIVGKIRQIRFTGTRADDMVVRFKYAGYAGEGEAPIYDPYVALRSCTRGEGIEAPLYVVATYTAMLAVRRGLVADGILKHYLEESA